MVGLTVPARTSRGYVGRKKVVYCLQLMRSVLNSNRSSVSLCQNQYTHRLRVAIKGGEPKMCQVLMRCLKAAGRGFSCLCSSRCGNLVWPSSGPSEMCRALPEGVINASNSPFGRNNSW